MAFANRWGSPLSPCISPSFEDFFFYNKNLRFQSPCGTLPRSGPQPPFVGSGQFLPLRFPVTPISSPFQPTSEHSFPGLGGSCPASGHRKLVTPICPLPSLHPPTACQTHLSLSVCALLSILSHPCKSLPPLENVMSEILLGSKSAPSSQCTWSGDSSFVQLNLRGHIYFGNFFLPLWTGTNGLMCSLLDPTLLINGGALVPTRWGSVWENISLDTR